MADFTSSTAAPPSRVLLVEGPNDKSVVRNLRKHFHGNRSLPDCHVRECGGVDPLLSIIEAELKVPGREALGILVDANDKPEDRWNDVLTQLRRARPGMAAHWPAPEGTIVADHPRVGVWLWPDNRSSGELEDFVAALIPGDDPVWPLSRRYIDGIPREHRKFAEKKVVRAKVHAWLATRRTPRFIGSAVGDGDLQTEGVLVARFVEWLRELFS